MTAVREHGLAGGASHSIVRRLVASLAVITLMAFTVVGTLLLWALRHELLRSERQDMDAKADVVQHFLGEVQNEAGLQELRHHLDDVLIGHGQLRIWLIADDGRVLYGGKQRPRIAEGADQGLTVWREDSVPLRGIRLQVPATAVLPATEVIVGYDTRERERLLRNYAAALILVCGFGLAFTVGLGAWVTRSALAPLRRLSREAAAITQDALSSRLRLDGAAAELTLLVDSFNRALDRVQAAYEQLHAFNADVAHELRTPLATMISGTEVTLARARSTDELRDTLASNLDELRQLAAMVDDMLFLAKADRGDAAQTLADVDVGDEARRVIEYFDAVLEERGQTIEVQGEACVPANASLLRRALANLVSNASRYTPAGSTITIALMQEPHGVRIGVRNPGPEIASHLLPRLFDRFFRADAARQQQADHHGLGLAIVRAVARMHGGETFATSMNGLTEIGFTMGQVPRSPASSAA